VGDAASGTPGGRGRGRPQAAQRPSPGAPRWPHAGQAPGATGSFTCPVHLPQPLQQ